MLGERGRGGEERTESWNRSRRRMRGVKGKKTDEDDEDEEEERALGRSGSQRRRTVPL